MIDIIISCGILITFKNKILLGHSTHKSFWDIPKGQKEEHETYLETMLRELKEETGLDFKDKIKDIQELGFFNFSLKKNLYLFRYELDELLDLSELYCASEFEENGLNFPEIDDFLFVDFSDIYKYANKSLNLLLCKVLNIPLVESQIDEIKGTINFVLRHKLPNNESRKTGWIDIDTFYEIAYNSTPVLKNFPLTELISFMKNDTKDRYIFKDNLIKINYGHSFDILEDKKNIQPPNILYHLTFDCFVNSILHEGLKPMTRNFVFLAETKNKAFEYKKKISNKNFIKKYGKLSPILLQIDAKKAFDDGLVFYKEKDNIICCKHIPPKYIHVSNSTPIYNDDIFDKILNIYKK